MMSPAYIAKGSLIFSPEKVNHISKAVIRHRSENVEGGGGLSLNHSAKKLKRLNERFHEKA